MKGERDMKETLKTLLKEINQSEEPNIEQILELLSCFQDADTLREKQLVTETKQAVAGILTNERIRMLDQRFFSSPMAELLAEAGNVKSYENLGTYQIEREGDKVCCVLQVIRLELEDGSEVHVANGREGRL